jgi:hypothetical protein
MPTVLEGRNVHGMVFMKEKPWQLGITPAEIRLQPQMVVVMPYS